MKSPEYTHMAAIEGVKIILGYSIIRKFNLSPKASHIANLLSCWQISFLEVFACLPNPKKVPLNILMVKASRIIKSQKYAF